MTFSFKGISSEEMGVKIITMSGVQRAPYEVEITAVPGRYEPLLQEKPGCKTTEITTELLVCEKTDIRRVFAWLTGKGQLIFSDEPDKYYTVFSNDVISAERIDGRIKAFEVKFLCTPYAYAVSNPFVSVPMNFTGTGADTSVSILSNGTAESEPLWFFSFAGKLKITLNDTDDPLIIDLPGHYSTSEYSYFGTDPTPYWHYKCDPVEIYIDTASRLAYRLSENGEKTVVTDLTSGRFPELSPGINTVKFELSNERWEHDGRRYIRSDQRLISFGYRKNERWY